MRLFHSPSSIALGARCQHAWALQYIAKIRSPELTWAEIEAGAVHTNLQRSAALGKAVHAVFEAWHAGGAPNWRGLPGEVALSGAHLIPHPTEATHAEIEASIGLVALPPRDRPGPTTALRVHGVLWAGYRDLLAYPTAACAARLGVREAWLLVDYKSTASIARYALTPPELARDVQANLYAIDVCESLKLDRIQARWLYLETKKVRRATPVDATLALADALEVMRAPAELARELDATPDVASAPKNPLACGDYGGCPHHISAGGPCDARRSIGGLIQARVKKATNQMALPADVQARFQALKSGAPQATPTAPAAAPIVTPAPDAADATTADAPAPRAPRGRPRAVKPPEATPVVEAPAAAPAASAVVYDVLSIAAELAPAQARVDELLALMRAALAA